MFLTYFCLVVLIVSGLFSLIRQYQMLQQNSYYAGRYFSWIKQNTKPSVLALKGLLLILVILSATQGADTFKASLPLFAAAGLYFGWRSYSLNSKSIKKLVFTPRIKRMFAFCGVLLVALFLVGIIIKGVLGLICLVILTAFALFPESLCFLSLFALKPCEKAIAKHFINDAKKILNSAIDTKIIGVTGSYGKTGTKYILSRILSEKYNVLHTPESFNTPMGVVRTVRENFRPNTEIFVCEMGAKNVGDIKELCDIANPHFGLITSVGPQHLETFKTVDNVFNTKFELYYSVKNSNGLVFANGDNELIRKNAPKDVILYGTDSEFPCYAKDIESGRFGASFTLILFGEEISVSTKLLGKHNILNIVGASAIAYKMGVKLKDIAFAISRLNPTSHRLELKSSVNKSVLIGDAYNANPEGSIEALNILNSFTGMKKVVITPGLVELGDKEAEYNKILGKTAAQTCDIIIFVGIKRSEPMVEGVKETDFNTENMYIASSFSEAMGIYSRFADENTVVLLENDLPDNYLK